MAYYIYQRENWTEFKWDEQAVNHLFGEVKFLQGRLSALKNMLGFSAKEEAVLATLTEDVLKSSEIEGEILNYKQVQSSIAERLGINIGGFTYADRNVQGFVDMLLDATQNYALPLTVERLFAWHAALFPTGRSIKAGQYRTAEMQVVSGAFGHEKVHYEAIPAADVSAEMDKFLVWLNESVLDNVLKSAIAHFWFVIIHPFDDGNGRTARAISDMLLARSEDSKDRFYSLSSQILKDKNSYYETLKMTQRSMDSDITQWLVWFLSALKTALLTTETTVNQILRKSEFWNRHSETALNERQRLMINKLWDNFFGNLTTSKWAKIAKCSQDTALRDIKNLIEKDILKQNEKGGRSVHYLLNI